MEQKPAKSLDGFQKSDPIILTAEAVLAALLQMLSDESDPDPPPFGGRGLTQSLAETV
jgi:hypothetical protein